jgi:predicted Zn-ribbon and HTH transcriptional regulator
MAAKAAPRKPARVWQVCRRCGYRVELPAASGPCLCPKCTLRCKWQDMVRVGAK